MSGNTSSKVVQKPETQKQSSTNKVADAPSAAPEQFVNITKQEVDVRQQPLTINPNKNRSEAKQYTKPKADVEEQPLTSDGSNNQPVVEQTATLHVGIKKQPSATTMSDIPLVVDQDTKPQVNIQSAPSKFDASNSESAVEQNSKQQANVQRQPSTISVITKQPQIENKSNAPVDFETQPQNNTANKKSEDEALSEKVTILSSDVKQLQAEVRQLQDQRQRHEMDESENNQRSQIYLGVATMFEWLSQKAPGISTLPVNRREMNTREPSNTSTKKEETLKDDHNTHKAKANSGEAVTSRAREVFIQPAPPPTDNISQEDLTKLAKENRNLLSKLEQQDMEIGQLSTQNQKLAAENNYLSTVRSQLLAQYQDLQAQHKAHRCASDDDLEIRDSDIGDKFVELAKTIAFLFDDYDAENLKIDAVREISRLCRTSIDSVWWNAMDDQTRKNWLSSLLANALYVEFFAWPFFGLADEQQEVGLNAFEKMLFEKNSGVSERHALEWRARTFRIADLLNRKREASQASQITPTVNELKKIFKFPFKDGDEGMSTLYDVCEMALHCAILLRKSKSKYSWQQWSLPAVISQPAVEIKRIQKPQRAKGAKETQFDMTFNVFGEVVKAYRKAGSSADTPAQRVVISRAVVATSVGK